MATIFLSLLLFTLIPSPPLILTLLPIINPLQSSQRRYNVRRKMFLSDKTIKILKPLN